MQRLYWLAAVLALALAAPAGAQERTLIEGGRRAFEIHCSNCHGGQARGDGPMAEMLTVPPADLRRISLRNEGEFPFRRVYRIIDGREEVRGHGMREMPVWGLTFMERGSDVPQTDQVRGRILQLIHYLQSIQLEPETETQTERRKKR